MSELFSSRGGAAPAVCRPGARALAGVLVFRGLAGQVRLARAWAREIASVYGADPDTAGLVVSELAGNAVRHSRSGQRGGLVAVMVTAGADSVTVHVHDEGTGEVPCGPLAAGEADGRMESGRGLAVVDAVSARWGSGPAGGCAVIPAPLQGRCTWALMTAVPRRGIPGPQLTPPCWRGLVPGGERL